MNDLDVSAPSFLPPSTPASLSYVSCAALPGQVSVQAFTRLPGSLVMASHLGLPMRPPWQWGSDMAVFVLKSVLGKLGITSVVWVGKSQLRD